ncbi:MAG: 50S ribosomal protein L19 [Armatimonadetes bacterium]|nr:50S ribosomal protein L19 [Armatimonadota bacterium]
MIKAQLAHVTQKHLKQELPEFSPGDTVRVNVKVVERVRNQERTRLQAFEGIVIARSGSGINEEFTVRRVSHGVGCERTFPIHSPVIDSVNVVRHGDVRRAKLYYLRDRVGKRARVRERARRPKEVEAAEAAKAAEAAAAAQVAAAEEAAAAEAAAAEAEEAAPAEEPEASE